MKVYLNYGFLVLVKGGSRVVWDKGEVLKGSFI